MQPLNDDELDTALRKWEAPAAPPELEQRVLDAANHASWKKRARWLLRGSIRVPVPVGVGAVLLLVFLAAQVFELREPPAGTLSDFEPVSELKPRILRSADEITY
ncbi:MAG: hypothetical protein GY953_48510 [bacterium]|nr:hypothetical protein [bacterium]